MNTSIDEIGYPGIQGYGKIHLIAFLFYLIIHKDTDVGFEGIQGSEGYLVLPTFESSTATLNNSGYGLYK